MAPADFDGLVGFARRKRHTQAKGNLLGKGGLPGRCRICVLCRPPSPSITIFGPSGPRAHGPTCPRAHGAGRVLVGCEIQLQQSQCEMRIRLKTLWLLRLRSAKSMVKILSHGQRESRNLVRKDWLGLPAKKRNAKCLSVAESIIYVGFLDLYFEFLDLYFGFPDLYFGCLNLYLGV